MADRYLGIAKEVTYGTPVAPASWVDIISESMNEDNQPLIAETVVRGHRKFAAGPFKAAGGIDLYVEPENCGLLLLAALGKVTSTQQGATTTYKHEFEPQTPLPSLTLEKNLDGIQAVRYAGCKARSIGLDFVAGELVAMSADFIAKTLSLESEGSPVFSPLNPFVFHQGTFTLDAGDISGQIESCSVEIENNMQDDEFGLGDRTLPRATAGALVVRSSLDVRFIDDSLLKKFLGSATATSPEDELTEIDCNIKCVGPATGDDSYTYDFEVDLPRCVMKTQNVNINRVERLVEGIEVEALYSSTDAYVVMITLMNKVISY